MRDIILTGTYTKRDRGGRPIPIVRIQIHTANKYSNKFKELHKLVTEKRNLEKVSHEKDQAQLKENAGELHTSK